MGFQVIIKIYIIKNKIEKEKARCHLAFFMIQLNNNNIKKSFFTMSLLERHNELFLTNNKSDFNKLLLNNNIDLHYKEGLRDLFSAYYLYSIFQMKLNVDILDLVNKKEILLKNNSLNIPNFLLAELIISTTKDDNKYAVIKKIEDLIGKDAWQKIINNADKNNEHGDFTSLINNINKIDEVYTMKSAKPSSKLLVPLLRAIYSSHEYDIEDSSQNSYLKNVSLVMDSISEDKRNGSTLIDEIFRHIKPTLNNIVLQKMDAINKNYLLNIFYKNKNIFSYINESSVKELLNDDSFFFTESGNINSLKVNPDLKILIEKRLLNQSMKCSFNNNEKLIRKRI